MPKRKTNLRNINNAIIQWNSENNNLTLDQLYETYGITDSQFIYHNYTLPKKKEKQKFKTIDKSKGRTLNQQYIPESNIIPDKELFKNYKSTRRSNKNRDHYMYNDTVPIEQPIQNAGSRRGSTDNNKKEFNFDEHFDFKNNKFRT